MSFNNNFNGGGQFNNVMPSFHGGAAPQQNGGGYQQNGGGYQQNGGGYGFNNNRGGFGRGGGGGYGRGYGNNRNNRFVEVQQPVDFTKMSDAAPAVDGENTEADVEKQVSTYTATTTRSGEEVNAWMEEHTITMYGERVPQPIFGFDELAAPDAIQRAFKAAGYTSPSCIQSAAWPILLSARDFVGVAKTGSGKTLGFMIPAIMGILTQPPLKHGDGPLVLVLAPTRELAVQIENESKKVMQHLPRLRSTCIYGGAPKYIQAKDLRFGVHVCIATPGRLIDMLTGRCTNLLRVRYLVLDEADRMLDMGFEPQIRQIVGQISTERQTVMFSATWPEEIRALASSFQKDFIRVHVGSEKLLANSDVKQHFAILQDSDKVDKMLEIMNLVGRRRILVFSKTKKTADMLWSGLSRAGHQVMCIHGDKDQNQRDRAIERFKMNPVGCLVATDIAARGLDIKQLEIVINYDFPTNIEDYVHRIGRTGRAGAKGDAYTFLTTDMSSKTVRDLIDLLKRSNQEVPSELFGFASSCGSGASRFGNRNFGRHRQQSSGPVQYTPAGTFIGGDDGLPFSASAVSSPIVNTAAPLPTPAATSYNNNNASYRNNNNNGYNAGSYNNNNASRAPAADAAVAEAAADMKADAEKEAPHGDYNFRKRTRFVDSEDEE